MVSGSVASSAFGLKLKRGPIKRPDRALEKLVRVYRPCSLFSEMFAAEAPHPAPSVSCYIFRDLRAPIPILI